MRTIELRRETNLETGMKRYNHPPPYGLIFSLNGRYRFITMTGVKFPLLVLLYNKEDIILDRFIAYPGQDRIPINPDTWTMIEIPYNGRN